VLARVANSVAARSKPAEVLRSIARAVQRATILEGERGGAASVVSQLLARTSA
jgi:hypothetical protein